MRSWVRILYWTLALCAVMLAADIAAKHGDWVVFAFAVGWLAIVLVEQVGNRLEKILLVAPVARPKPVEWVNFRLGDRRLIYLRPLDIHGVELKYPSPTDPIGRIEVALYIHGAGYYFGVGESIEVVSQKLGLHRNYSTEPGKAGMKQWP